MAIHLSHRGIQASMGPAPHGRWSRIELEDFLDAEITIIRRTCKHSKRRQEIMIITEIPDRPLNEIASAILATEITGDVILIEPWELESMNSKTITLKGNQ